MTERARGEQHRRRLLADVTVRHDGVARRDPRAREQRSELGGAAQLEVVVGDLGVRQALRAGDVSPCAIRPSRRRR
jgi:hypothetical protein